ncbi:MAG: hypothetical protein ABSH17_00560 [Syntrophobacteraceae bacterium]
MCDLLITICRPNIWRKAFSRLSNYSGTTVLSRPALPIRKLLSILLAILVGLLAASTARADGIIPDRNNQVIIQGQFSDPAPKFLLIFSAKPLRDSHGRLLTSLIYADFAKFKRSYECLVIKVYGKKKTASGRIDYFFGTSADAEKPWNNGSDFHWKDWAKYSPDIWDNLCIIALPESKREPEIAANRINKVTIRRGGNLLYDSRATQSYPNKKPIKAAFKPIDLNTHGGASPVLNLAEHMARFRNDYYELNNNPILTLAYANLAQTSKKKYVTRRCINWCSKFCSYLYRRNGIMTPDPNRVDVYWKNMREFFERNGKVYTAREVSSWSNQKKISLIKPGSFVSILVGNSTHSIMFTTWVMESDKPITKYVGISGNNKKMVWAHRPLALPTNVQLGKMTAEKLREYDQKVFFGVPAK